MNFDDFYGETKLLLTSLDSRINREKSMSDHLYSFFIMESESSPEEKEYDYFETTSPKVLSNNFFNGEYINQYTIEEVAINQINERTFHPSIRTKYYNQGFYSDIYAAFKCPILDRVYNKALNSLYEYNKGYDVKSYARYTFLGIRPKDTNKDKDMRDALWARNIHIEFPTEYLRYHKLPMGSITFISNTTVDTTNMHDDRSYYIKPLKNEIIDIKYYDLDPSRYTCYIDSTIIHTDYNIIESIHNELKSHPEYRQYEIESIDENIRKKSIEQQPNYVVEHFCRIIKQKAERDKILEISSLGMAKLGHEMSDIKKIKEVVRENHYSHKDHIRRAIIFQGLTRMDKEFYSPDYSKTPLPTQGDYRRTLYWNPNVQTDSTGCASVEFYNNSSCTKYNIDAQTVTKNGEIGVLYK